MAVGQNAGQKQKFIASLPLPCDEDPLQIRFVGRDFTPTSYRARARPLTCMDRTLGSPSIVPKTASPAVCSQTPMHIAILTFEGYNELDSFVSLGILNRINKPDWRVSIASPSAKVRSMNGLVVEAQATLQEASTADAVVVGSGLFTRDVVADLAMMSALKLDPARQLLAAQCSGTLVLAKLGLLNGVSACTDLTTKPWVQEAGVDVLNQPFFARGNVATAGGCLASPYLAAWIIARLEGIEAAESALHYVAPVGEKAQFVKLAMSNILPFLPTRHARLPEVTVP